VRYFWTLCISVANFGLYNIHWELFLCSDTNDYSEFRWKNPIWNHSHDAHEPIEALLIKEALTMATIGKILMTMNKHELNLFGTSRLASNTQKRCQLIFRQSNVNYSRCLCLHLSGMYWNLQNETFLAKLGTFAKQKLKIAEKIEFIFLS